MSNRTLLELNHDHGDRVTRDPEAFVSALLRYIATGDERFAMELEQYGFRVLAQRHHSDDFHIQYGPSEVSTR